jgi:hypothetical protein
MYLEPFSNSVERKLVLLKISPIFQAIGLFWIAFMYKLASQLYIHVVMGGIIKCT